MTSPAAATGFGPRLTAWSQGSFALVVVACLLSLASANIWLRASWTEAEDGVLWTTRAEGVVAVEVAPLGAGANAGVQAGDLLLAIDGRPVDRAEQVVDSLHRSRAGDRLEYTVLRQGQEALRHLSLQPVPQGHRSLYFVLAGIAVFTLLVGCSVRLRRPSDPATLHFFWLTVAFFGVFAFSFSGRLDRLDWFFYWADVVALLVLPPLFVHFALVFPDRPTAWARSHAGRTLLPLLYLPAGALGVAKVMAVLRGSESPLFTTVLQGLDRLELLHLSAGLVAGFAIMGRALGRIRSVTARRQLRWIVWGTAVGAVPFALAYLAPVAAGFAPWPGVEWLALALGLVPLAFASAVVRYRLADVEVIIKRGVVYAVAISAIAAIYAVLLKLANEFFFAGGDQSHSVIAVLATLVVVLLAPLVKNSIQTTLDRAYYRDRYDYRRALLGFARDLNADLDIERLAAKLVERVRTTLVLDRMALLIAPADGSGDWVPLNAEGFEPHRRVRVPQATGVGGRLTDGHIVSLDEPQTLRRFAASEVAHWRDLGLHYFVPCVSKDRTIAVLALGGKESSEPLNSEDMELLAAVAGQVATAIENGRLYHQLRVKADELNRLREFSENIIASLNDGLLVMGLDDRIVRWNPALESLYGVSRTEAAGQPVDAVFPEPFVTALRAARQEGRAGAGALLRVSLESRHADGPRPLLVNVAIAPLRTPDHAVAGTIVILEDTTTRVKLEEQLQISEKMASIGLLAAGVAHEVNTPLTGISSYTQMLLDGADRSDPRTTLLEKIERQTFRAAKIVNGLLNLARPAQVDAGPIDVHAVINDVLALLEHQFKGGNIQLRKELTAAAPVVNGIEHKLQQVFLNLFLNARDAMPKGGWLSIASRNDGDQVVVEVADTGSGIRAEHLSRIYDPFFTTKPTGQGTGLGLSITYGILQEHGGAISCQSTVGQGTRFVLTFPPAAATARQEKAAR